MTIVAHIATRRLVCCRPDSTLREIAERLADERVHAVFVIDADEQPAGVVSDLDLLTGEWLGGDEAGLEAMRSVTAADVMSSPVETIDSQADACEAARRLRTLGIHRLLVMEAGRPAGVVSVGDLIAELGRTSGGAWRTVRDVMSPAFVTSGLEATVRQVARAMTERRSRSVVLIDGGCTPRGVVTGFDLLAALEGDDGLGDEPVSRLAADSVVTIAPGASLRDAADLMLEHGAHRLLVVEDGHSRPMGIISTADIFVDMARPGSRWDRRG
jgi:CBS domain-containing protein